MVMWPINSDNAKMEYVMYMVSYEFTYHKELSNQVEVVVNKGW